jgi:hypothetical protein
MIPYSSIRGLVLYFQILYLKYLVYTLQKELLYFFNS